MLVSIMTQIGGGRSGWERVEFFCVLFKQRETPALIGYSFEDFPSRIT